MEATSTLTPTVLSAADIAHLPDGRFGVDDAVTHKVLWRAASSVCGLLTIPRGHRLGVHRHRSNHHHIWVVEGSATVLDQVVTAGGYVHVPSGVDHDIDATATAGCTVFYVYEPTP